MKHYWDKKYRSEDKCAILKKITLCRMQQRKELHCRERSPGREFALVIQL
jgi:hypothetical protein